MLNRLKGSRSSSRKGQGHWSFLPVVVKPIHLFVLNVVYGVWMECGIFLDGQGHGHAKVKVKGIFSPICSCYTYGSFTPNKNKKVLVEFRIFCKVQSQGHASVKVI